MQDINGIKVDRIDEIARLKLLAAQANPDIPYRTAARDLHDLAYIASRYNDDLTDETIRNLDIFFADQSGPEVDNNLSPKPISTRPVTLSSVRRTVGLRSHARA